MAYDAKTERLIALKKLSGKAHTSNDKGLANEPLPSGITMSTATIFASTITTAPNSSSPYQVTGNVEFLRLPCSFKAGTNTVAGRHGFEIKLPSDYESSSSNSKKGTYPYTNNQIINITSGSLQLIPPSFAPSYEAKPHYGTLGSGTQIPLLDARDWNLDYFNAVLFQQDPPGTGDHAQNPTYVEAFLYIGDYLSDAVGLDGDISAVVAGTGLSGGATSGIATVNLDVNSLAAEGTGGALADSVAIADADDNATKKITLTQLKALVNTDTNTTYTAGNGLGLSGTEFALDLKPTGGLKIDSTELAMDINGLAAETGGGALADSIAISDANSSNVTKKITLTQLQTLVSGAGDVFKTISVSGQSDVVADSATDTLTLAAGANVAITTNAGSDTVTIAATDTNTTYTAADGLDLTGTAFSVDLKEAVAAVGSIRLDGGMIDNYHDADITIISTDETSVNYTFDKNSAPDNTGPVIKIQGLGNDKAAIGAKLAAGINHSGGHNGKITAVSDGESTGPTITLTQTTAGTAGNTTISYDDPSGAGIAVAAQFSGGATGGGLKIVSTELAVEPSDFAGSGLEDDGSDNLRIAAAAAGVGLSGGAGAALAVDLNELTAATVDVSADSIAIIDANDSNASRKEAIADIITATAGSGLAASAGVLSVDIDELAALGGTGLHQTQDHFVFSDNGTEKKITFSNLEDAIFGNVTGDAAIAGGGALTIAANAVEGSMINSNAAGDGLAYASNALKVDLNELTAAVVDVAADSIAIVDANDSNASRKESIGDLITAIAGNGLAASSGVLAVGVDGTGIEINSDALRLKDSGVTLAKMANLADMKVIGNVSGGTAAPAAIAILDEDNMASNSATSLVTQQSVKAYVDSISAGLDPKESVVTVTTASFTMASTASASTLVLADGEGGFSASGDTLTIDGVSVPTTSRVLIKDGVNSNGAGVHNKWNGIYTVGALTGATLTLTRATDFDATAEITGGAHVFIEQGTTNGDTGYVCTNDSAVTVGTTAITWSQFSGPGVFSAGDGLDLSGKVFSLDIKSGGGLKIDSTELAVEPTDIAGVGLEDDGSDNLRLNVHGLAADGNAGNLSDAIAIADASDSNLTKKITLTQLKTLVGAGASIAFKTISIGPAGKKVRFTNNFGMGSYGTVPSNIILRFSDGSTNHDFTVDDNSGSSTASATTVGGGTDRSAADVVAEFVSEINAGSLNVTAAVVSGNTSTDASFTVEPDAGYTVTVTEDPGNANSGNFGDAAGFTLVTSISGQDDVVADSATDTLTLLGDTGINITTTAATDKIAISTTAAQSHVTSLGTLTSLGITGDLTVDTNTLYVKSSTNKVGIGTTSPSASLEVKAAAHGDGIYLEDDGTATKVVKLKADSGGGVIELRHINNEQNVRLDATSDSWINGGNVGIGTESPAKKLDVAGDFKVSGTTTLNGIEYTWPASDGNSGQQIQTDGNGALSWVAAESVIGSTGQRDKDVYPLSQTSALTNITVSSTDLSAVDYDPNSIDIFLNGMLMHSGSATDVATSSADYCLTGASTLKFAFAVEADDLLDVVISESGSPVSASYITFEAHSILSNERVFRVSELLSLTTTEDGFIDLDINRKKITQIMSSPLTAGNALASGYDFRKVSYSSDRIDVFVNGVLLLSGSSRDYYLQPTSNIIFGFNLFIDDHVTINII